jgi:hypothetical protein
MESVAGFPGLPLEPENDDHPARQYRGKIKRRREDVRKFPFNGRSIGEGGFENPRRKGGDADAILLHVCGDAVKFFPVDEGNASGGQTAKLIPRDSP